MSDAPGRARLAILLVLLAAGPARAEPSVRILDCRSRSARCAGRAARSPSRWRPPVSPQPIARAGKEPVPLVLVWGEEGGRHPHRGERRIAAKPVGREAVEDLVASETPRGALPGIRRALDGPLSAFLTGRTRGPDGAPAATTLTLRERQPLAVSTDPKPVPVPPPPSRRGRGGVRPARAVDRLPRRAPGRARRDPDGRGIRSLVLATRPATNSPTWTLAPARSPAPAPPSRRSATFRQGHGRRDRRCHRAAEALEPRPRQDRARPRGRRLHPRRWRGRPRRCASPRGRGGSRRAGGGRAGPRHRLGPPGPERARPRDAPRPGRHGCRCPREGALARLVVGLGDGRVAAVALDGGTP